ncbi:MAG: response regulator [Desulfovibrionaceae bacterium]
MTISPGPEAAGRPLRILLVEDNADNVLVIQLYLRGYPFDIVVAEDGRQGVDLFLTQAFDLVLLDLFMPVMDGYEAVRLMREHEAAAGKAHTPILAVTAHASDENERRVRQAGCDGYLTKPIPKARLIQAIAEATERL